MLGVSEVDSSLSCQRGLFGPRTPSRPELSGPLHALPTSMLSDEYIQDLDRHAPLDRAEERELDRRLLEGDESARSEYVEGNLRFAVDVAKKYSWSGIPLEDLTQMANMGLMTAAKRYDPTRPNRFITYAVWWIKQKIHEGLAEQKGDVRLPTNRGAELAKLRRVHADIYRETGEAPTAQEVADAADVSLETARTLIRADTPSLSLDEPGHGQLGDEGVTLGERIGADDGLEVALDDWSRGQAVEQALSALRPRDRRVLRLFYGLEGGREHTLEEISRLYDVTRERVRQIKDRALEELREEGGQELLADVV